MTGMKRASKQTYIKTLQAGLNDLVEDAVSVIRYTKSLSYVDEERVIVCGHSEGSMIATLLSTKEDTAGLLLLGGAATCMKDALLYQNYLAAQEFAKKKGLLGMLLRSQTSQEKTNAKVDAMFQKCVSAKKDRVFFGGTMLNAKWVKEHASHRSEDYVALLEQYGKPILAVTGTADISTDYRRLSALQNIPLAESYTPHNVNHILREIDDDNSVMTVKKQYGRLAAQPIHSDTEQYIRKWLSQFQIYKLDRATGHYRCKECHHLFQPTIAAYLLGMRSPTKRYLRCPKCRKYSYCRVELDNDLRNIAKNT